MVDNARSTAVPFGPSLRQRVVNAGAWAIAGLALIMLLRLASNLLMTRLLAPELFGLVAMTAVVMNALGMFSDLGLKQSIIQSQRGDDPLFLNTAWALQIVRGTLLWFCAIIVSVCLAIATHHGLIPSQSVYADPRSPYVIAIMSSCIAIGSFGSTRVPQASRKLSVGRIAQIDLAGQSIGLLCMLGWATFDRSIWTLVAGAISGTLVRVVLSHAWMPGRANRWQWSRSAFLELARFGRWILISSGLGFMAHNSDRLLLGWLGDPVTLGLYAIASLISGSIEGALAVLASEIAFPAFSEIARERRDELKKRYYQLYFVIAIPTYFIAGMLIVGGETVVNILYDSRYAQAGWMLEMLATAMLTVPMRTALQSFLAIGEPRILTITVVVRLVATVIATPIGFLLFGVAGALWAITLTQFSYIPIIVFASIKHELFDLRKELICLSVVVAGIGAARVFTAAIGH